MAAEFKWYASCDQENYTVGPRDSREAIVQAAMDQDLGLRQGPEGHWDRLTFYIMEANKLPVDLAFHLNDDSVIEGICESVEDEHGGEDSCLCEDAWTRDQENDLRDRLRKTVAEWQADHKIVVLPWIFTNTRNSETVDVQVPLPVN